MRAVLARVGGRGVRAVGACVPLLVLAVLPGTAAGRSPSRGPRLVGLRSTPALFPAFSPGVHDYVVRCRTGSPVRFTVSAAGGTTPWIDGRPGRTRRVGLRAGREAVIAGRGAGGGEVVYHVRCLPADFPGWTVTGAASTNDMYLVAPSMSLGTAQAHYIAVFDREGVPVWWYRIAGVPFDAELLPGPTIAFASYPTSSPSYQLHRLDGALVGRIVSPDGRIDDHELQSAAGGNYFFLVYEPKRHVDLSSFGGPADATVLEAEIEEVSPAGSLLWSWTSDGRVDLSESERWLATILKQPVLIPGPDNTSEPAYDFFHANAISVGKDVVLVSLRQTDAVYAIDRGSGQILWKLGGTRTPQSLTVVGDPDGAAPLAGQHDVRLLPDGTVSAFDDGSFLRAPRVVRYRIDPVAHTATLLDQITDPAVTGTLCCGSARTLADGDWLISWGSNPTIGEYRPGGTPVFKLIFDDGLFSYRAVPVPAGTLPVAQLRAGMNALAARR